MRAPSPKSRLPIALVVVAVATAGGACDLAITGTAALQAGDAGDVGDADRLVDASAPPGDDGAVPSGDSGAFRANDGASDGADAAADAAHTCVPFAADAGVLGALALSGFHTKSAATWNESLDGKITLTNSNNFEKGAAWSPTLLPVAFAYHLSFQIRVGPNDTAGDGIAFAVLQGSAEPSVGDDGDGIGLRNLAGYTGYAVVIDMYKTGTDATDLATTTLKLVTMPNFVIVAKAGLNEALNDGNNHAIDVSLSGGNTLTATLHGPTQVVTTTLTDQGFATIAPAYFGFTAATGGGSNSHNEVASITIADACR